MHCYNKSKAAAVQCCCLEVLHRSTSLGQSGTHWPPPSTSSPHEIFKPVPFTFNNIQIFNFIIYISNIPNGMNGTPPPPTPVLPAARKTQLWLTMDPLYEVLKVNLAGSTANEGQEP